MTSSTQKPKSHHQSQINQFPIKKLDVQDFFLPQLTKKKVVHSKNPFKVKPLFFPDESLRKKKTLNGMLFLEVTHTELPHEVIKADISNQNITEINAEDLKYFVNLEELDLSENTVNINDLRNLPVLKILKLRSSLLDKIPIENSDFFSNLQTLDLAFNKIPSLQIKNLFNLPLLRNLNLSGNDLKELPDELTALRVLEDFDISFNSFNSEHKASQFWFSLASLPSLKILNVSRNFLRGIHTEKLVAGNFNGLEKLDFSYNIVENQHNLISARNFANLRIIDVTGNPFAVGKAHKGLAMEIYAKTGAELINHEITKPYLRKKSAPEKKSINFPNMIRLQEQIIKRDNKTYFFGVQLPGFYKDEATKAITPAEEIPQALVEEKSDDEEKFQRFFLTEEQNIKENHKKKEVTKVIEEGTQEFGENRNSKLEEQKTLIAANYDEFKKAAFQIVGDNKEYENAINLNSAYKILKNIMKKPNSIEFEDFAEPHYMKPTSVIQKFKFNDEAKELEKMASEYLKGKLDKADQTEMGNVEKILDDLNRKLKKK